MIGATLRAAAAFVDDNASGAAWDPHQRLSDEQRFAKGEKIKGVASDLRALADASETRKLRYGEFEALKDRLYGFGFALSPDARAGRGHGVPRCRGARRSRVRKGMADDNVVTITGRQIREARTLLGLTRSSWPTRSAG